MQTQTPVTFYVRSSSNPNAFYTVAANPRGFLECDCPAARYRRDRPCKHAEQVRRGCGLVARPKASTSTDDLFSDGGAAIERSLASRRAVA